MNTKILGAFVPDTLPTGAMTKVEKTKKAVGQFFTPRTIVETPPKPNVVANPYVRWDGLTESPGSKLDINS